MHLILTGATGLVGSATLDAMLNMSSISKISILSRRPVAMADNANDPRVNVIIHKDFESYPPDLLRQLRGANGVVWALGISQTQVSADEYVKITKDYTAAGARAMSAIVPDGGGPFRFIYVSGMGATQTPGPFAGRFARVKGEAESLLDQMRVENPARFAPESFRAAGIDPAGHEAILPYVPQPSLPLRVFGAFAFPVLRNIATGSLTPTKPMGRFLAELAMGKHISELDKATDNVATLPGGLRLMENGFFRRVAGL